MSNKNPKPTHVALEDKTLALTDMQIGFDEELFVFLPVAGNRGVQYHLSPKHAKRISILLTQSIKSYEDKYGTLETKVAIRHSDVMQGVVKHEGQDLEANS
jgi:hypothetical protein